MYKKAGADIMAASGLRFKNALVGSEWATTELDPNPKAKN